MSGALILLPPPLPLSVANGGTGSNGGGSAQGYVYVLTGGTVTAQLPDSTTTGGNARGAGATELQTTRTTAAQVASGASAVIAGGANNTSSGVSSVVGGGSNNFVSSANGTIAGGSQGVVGGNNSWIPGGSSSTDRGHLGRGAWSAGQFSVRGDAQSGEFCLRNITTNNTATRITGDGAAASTINTLNLSNNGTYMVRLLVVAQQTGGSAGTAGDCAGWELTGLIKRGANAAATVLTGSSGASVAPAYNDAAAAAWRVGLTADTTNGGLAVTVTGETNKTIRWVARVMTVEVTA